MRITFLANRDIESNFSLNILTRKLEGHSFTFFLSDHAGTSYPKDSALALIRDVEQSIFVDHVFRYLERSSSKDNRFLTFNELGEKTGGTVSTSNDINSPQGLQSLRSSEPDLIVSIRYGRIIYDEAIGVPRFGILNLHSGILPKYRGIMATFWSMLFREADFGCTLHYIMDGTIDTGPIISIFQQKLDLEKDYLSNVISLYAPGCGLILDAIKKIDAGKSLEEKTPQGESNYYTFPRKEDFDKFKEMGYEMFNPSELIQFVRKYYHYNLSEDLVRYR